MYRKFVSLALQLKKITENNIKLEGIIEFEPTPYSCTLTLTLTFQSQTISLLGLSLYQVWTVWDHSFLSYAVDKQTNRRSQASYPHTPTDIVGVIVIGGRVRDVLVLCTFDWNLFNV